MRGERRLHQLVATAADMFLDVGYEALTVDHLIARVGGSRRNVYDHFGGKTGLFVEAVKHLCDEIAVPIEALPLRDGNLPAMLHMFGMALVRATLSPRALALHRLMIAEGQRFPELAQAIYAAGHQRAEHILAAALERSSDAFGSNIPTPVFAAQFVNLLVAGAQLRALVGLSGLPLPEDQIARIVDDALSFVTPRFRDAQEKRR